MGALWTAVGLIGVGAGGGVWVVFWFWVSGGILIESGICIEVTAVEVAPGVESIGLSFSLFTFIAFACSIESSALTGRIFQLKKTVIMAAVRIIGRKLLDNVLFISFMTLVQKSPYIIWNYKKSPDGVGTIFLHLIF